MNKMISRNDPCWCGSGIKYKKCHEGFDQKVAEMEQKGMMLPEHKLIKTGKDIEGMKESAKINIAVLDYVEKNIGPGISTETINKWVNEITESMGGVPAPLGYEGFPKSVCTSVNEQVCHGIPSEDVILKEGDIINVDVSTLYKGYYSDSSRMFCIGEVSQERKKLVDLTKECMLAGLKEVRPWAPLGNIGHAIVEMAHKNGCSVVREIGGHGIGLEFHEEPWVSHVAEAGTGIIMVPGLTFTIEPMVNAGTHKVFTDPKDDWSVYTADGRDSAQWEIMLVVTETGYEIISY